MSIMGRPTNNNKVQGQQQQPVKQYPITTTMGIQYNKAQQYTINSLQAYLQLSKASTITIQSTNNQATGNNAKVIRKVKAKVNQHNKVTSSTVLSSQSQPPRGMGRPGLPAIQCTRHKATTRPGLGNRGHSSITTKGNKVSNKVN